ncbi:PPM-type phosphatase domain, partial [Sesbania bispinosa]
MSPMRRSGKRSKLFILMIHTLFFIPVVSRGLRASYRYLYLTLLLFSSLPYISKSNLIALQVSRSIGDVYLKRPNFYRDPVFQQFGNPIPLTRPVMTAEPSITVRELQPEDLFIIFASDGLWEQLTDQEAVDIVFKYPRA